MPAAGTKMRHMGIWDEPSQFTPPHGKVIRAGNRKACDAMRCHSGEGLRDCTAENPIATRARVSQPSALRWGFRTSIHGPSHANRSRSLALIYLFRFVHGSEPPGRSHTIALFRSIPLFPETRDAPADTFSRAGLQINNTTQLLTGGATKSPWNSGTDRDGAAATVHTEWYSANIWYQDLQSISGAANTQCVLPCKGGDASRNELHTLFPAEMVVCQTRKRCQLIRRKFTIHIRTMPPTETSQYP